MALLAFVLVTGLGALFMVVFFTALCRDKRCTSGDRNERKPATGVFRTVGPGGQVTKITKVHGGQARPVVVFPTTAVRPTALENANLKAVSRLRVR